MMMDIILGTMNRIGKYRNFIGSPIASHIGVCAFAHTMMELLILSFYFRVPRPTSVPYKIVLPCISSPEATPPVDGATRL